MDTPPDLEERLAAFKHSITNGLEDYWIFMVPSSLGEVSAVCALSLAFKETYGGKVCIVAAENRRSLFYLFNHNIDAMRFAPKNAMRALSASKLLDPLRFEVGYPQNMWANQNRDGTSFSLHELYMANPSRGGLSFPDLVRYVLRLDWKSQISKGVIRPELEKPAWELAGIHRIVPGNSVVLFPGNNTNIPASAAFWNALSRSYAAAGKKVFYCLTGAFTRPRNLDILGVELDLNPGVAVAVCEIAGHMVSGSNGLMFLSLLTRSTFDIDVVLTGAKDGVGKGVFTPVDPQESSTYRGSPELVANLSRRYSEWVLPGDGDSLLRMVDEIVRAGRGGADFSDQGSLNA